MAKLFIDKCSPLESYPNKSPPLAKARIQKPQGGCAGGWLWMKLIPALEGFVGFSARSKFWGGVAGSEDFACATLPTTPLDFQGKI